MKTEKEKIQVDKPRLYLKDGAIIDRDAIGDPVICLVNKGYRSEVLRVLRESEDFSPNRPNKIHFTRTL
jgi:hypothetical protein